MDGYINRKDIFPNGVFFASEENPLASLDALIERIWSIPAADVVEVVRCKDCKHRRDYGMCDHPKAIGWDAIAPEDDDFCSCGERRADNAAD